MERSRPHRRHKMLLCPIWAELRCQLLKVQCCCLAYAEDLHNGSTVGLFSCMPLLLHCLLT